MVCLPRHWVLKESNGVPRRLSKEVKRFTARRITPRFSSSPQHERCSQSKMSRLHKKGSTSVELLKYPEFRERGEGREFQPGVNTSRGVLDDVWANRSFMARFLPLNGGKEAVRLAICWKVLHKCICIHRMLAYPSLLSFIITINNSPLTH